MLQPRLIPVLLVCLILSCSSSSDTAGEDVVVDTQVEGQDVTDNDTVADDTAVDGQDTTEGDQVAPEDTEDTQDTAPADSVPPDTAADVPSKKPDGETCEGNSECESDNCRKKPAGGSACAPVGALCADGQGGGLAAGEGVCVEGDSHICQPDGTFLEMKCEQSCGYFPDVEGCDSSTGLCNSCPDSCSASSGCDEGATCNESGVCVPGAQGVLCSGNDDCPSLNCRNAPDGSKRCAPPEAECADGEGGGLAPGEQSCYSGDLYTCQAGGSFAAPQDCMTECGLYKDVDGCHEGSCKVCASSCDSDGGCKPEAHCDGTDQCAQDLGVGQTCERDAICESNNCRVTPDGGQLCVSAIADCAGAGGVPLGAGEQTCYSDDSYTCIGKDAFINEDCADECGYYPSVDGCSDGHCTPCATTCSNDAECDANAHCDQTNRCVAKQASGQPCTDDSGCDSNNCRMGPDDEKYCTPAGKPCSDMHGGSLDVGQSTCHQNKQHECIAQDAFNEIECLQDCGLYVDVDSCEGTHCQPCPAICEGDSQCKEPNHCTASQCYSNALGQRCDDDPDCDENTCRMAPDGLRYCAPSGSECSDGATGGVCMDCYACHDNKIYKCTGDGFADSVKDCRETTCIDGKCMCEDTHCAMSKASGCDGDRCVCGAVDECPPDGTMSCDLIGGAYQCNCNGTVCDLEKANDCGGGESPDTCRCGWSDSSCPGEQFCKDVQVGFCFCPANWLCHEGFSDGCWQEDCGCGSAYACPRPMDLEPDEFHMQCDAGTCKCDAIPCWADSGTGQWRSDRCTYMQVGHIPVPTCRCGQDSACPEGQHCDPDTATCQ